MGFTFPKVEPMLGVSAQEWNSWLWQARKALKSLGDFQQYFELSSNEIVAFQKSADNFKIQVTPYYARLANRTEPADPIRKILMPSILELSGKGQQMLDPLGEQKHRPVERIIHRYPDRVLFLVTDTCSVYCRYCTRKHFTGKDQAAPSSDEYSEALSYIAAHTEIHEVILSGGDPLTLSDSRLEQILFDLRKIEHVEIIRIGTRLPVVAPMRVTEDLIKVLRANAPVFIMTHFNHPREITFEAAEALSLFVDHGLPVFNQLVLLNGVNNHSVIIEALSRRLLYLRVKPYYMFQADPSEGTDHLRTSVEQSLQIQRQMWGRVSGLALPNLSLDIPGGGGKVGLVPNFEIAKADTIRKFRGWDGIEGEYQSPSLDSMQTPIDVDQWR